MDNTCCNKCNNIGYLDKFNGCTYPNCDCHKLMEKETWESLQKEYKQAVMEIRPQDWWIEFFWPKVEKYFAATLASQKEKMLGVLEKLESNYDFNGIHASFRLDGTEFTKKDYYLRALSDFEKKIEEL